MYITYTYSYIYMCVYSSGMFPHDESSRRVFWLFFGSKPFRCEFFTLSKVVLLRGDRVVN